MKDKKRAMGRGLGAILSAETKSTINSATDTGAEQLVVGNMVEVALEDIYPNATQPRTYFDETALQRISSIYRNLGVIQPITLRKTEINSKLFLEKDVSELLKLQVLKAFLHT